MMSAQFKFRLFKFWTRAIILFERLTHAFWPVFLWLGVALLILISGVTLNFPPFLHWTVIFFLMCGFCYVFFLAVKLFRLPSEYEVLKRLEEASSIPHRQLRIDEDSLVNPDGMLADTLWAHYKTRIHETVLRRLKLAIPRPVLSAKDPFALRYMVVLALVTGVIITGPDLRSNLKASFAPTAFMPSTPESTDLTIRITPPAYTNKSDTLISGSEAIPEILSIEQGSVVAITARSYLGAPVLRLNSEEEKTDSPLHSVKYPDYTLETILESQLQSIAIHNLIRTLVTVPVQFIPDTPPHIEEKEPPETTRKGDIQLSIMVKDDYGVESLHMTMNIDPVVEDAPIGSAHAEDRSVLSPANEEFTFQPLYDLSAHPWAGLPAIITLVARDSIGQVATLDNISVILPERDFTNPIARVLIALRKQMIWSNGRLSLEEQQDVIETLHVLLEKPSTFKDDLVVYLGLRTASSRMYYAPDEATIHALIPLFWNLALRLEDGNLSLAERALRDVKDALEEALKNPETSEADIARLSEDLQNALRDYFQALQEEFQKQLADGKSLPIIPPDAIGRSLSAENLRNFIERLQDRLLSGDRQSAQNMLSQLRNLMDMLDPSIEMPFPPDMQMMSEGVNELQELIDKQKELLDKTLAAAEDEDIANSSTEQDALRIILGQLMQDIDREIGEIPETTGLAELEMRQSADYLRDNDGPQSVPHQEKAIEYLEESQESLAQQFSQRMQQMIGFGFSMGPRDPLGRPMGNGTGGNPLLGQDDVEIPDEDQKRADDVLKILRERLGDYSRPPSEREYLRRLLRRF